jgi:predicted GNAT family acetyltransferase
MMSDTADASGRSVDVRRNDARHRYELTAGGEVAGFAFYRDEEGRRVFYHTEIGEAFGGQGLGTVLIAHALADTRDSGMRFVPVCPFVGAYLRKHPEFGDIAEPVTSELLSRLKAESAQARNGGAAGSSG